MKSKEDATAARYAVAILKSAGGLTPEKRLASIQSGLSEVPSEIRPDVENAVLAGVAAGERTSAALSDRALATVGIGLVLLVVVLVGVWPTPSYAQNRAFGVLIALGGAFAGAALPGALTVELSTKREGVVRATGSLGLMVVLLLYWSGWLF